MSNSNEDGNLLPIHESNGEATVDSREIAKGLGNEHKRLLELIKTHQKAIEKDFGLITFKTSKSDNQRGRATRVANLNEGQAVALVTLSRNTAQSVPLKLKIAKSFLMFRQMAYELKSNASNLVHIAENVAMSVIPNDKHVFVVTNKNLALAMAVAPSTISSHKTRHEQFKEGVHYINNYITMDFERNREYETTVWTQRGVIELARKVQSGNCVVFRDWGDAIEGKKQNNLPMRNIQPKKRKHNRLTPERILVMMQTVQKIEDNEIRQTLTSQLTEGYV